MGKGSKRRTGENTTQITSNWDEINWGRLKDTKNEESGKKKNERNNDNTTDRD